MQEKAEVKRFYDDNAVIEWERLEMHPFEYKITLNFMNRYIKPNDKILDVSGGPGRYSIYFAKKGCDVTLVDLSSGNIELAKKKADENGVEITALVGDACLVDQLLNDVYDHVFLMGALYHLQTDYERTKAVNACLKLLKPGGIFFASYISIMAGVHYYLKDASDQIIDLPPHDIEFFDKLYKKEDYTGEGFTYMHMMDQDNILSFMEKFNLSKLNFFSQESILAQMENKLKLHSQEVQDKWIEIALRLAERKELLSHGEHLMYIGRKNSD